MKGHTPPLLFLATALLAPAAEPAVPSAAENSATPSPATAPAPGLTVSPQTSARVTAELPSFESTRISVPPAETPGNSPLLVSPNRGDSATPNVADIVQLPRYEVRDDPLPTFKERELLTPEGRVELALKRHPGFKIGPLVRLNIRRAVEWLAEEEQAVRNREMAELVNFQTFVAELRQTPDATVGAATPAAAPAPAAE